MTSPNSGKYKIAGVLIFVLLLVILAAWALSPVTDYSNAKSDCLRYQQATGFETKWVHYRFLHGECMVRLQTPSENGIKWLPVDQVTVIVTTAP